MSPDAAAERGLVHEAAFYDGDKQFLELVVPFVQDGLDAREPTLVALADRRLELVGSIIAPSPYLSFVPSQYDRPASVLKSFDKVLRGYLAQGAQQLRIVGELPHRELGVPWPWWARYEATVNHAFAQFPLRTRCLFDRRVISDEVLADVAQTHPHLANSDGHYVRNDRYTEPAAFLSQPRSPRADPLETSPPVIELMNPTASQARRAVRHASNATRLYPDDVADLVTAVSETVTNAFCHGRLPAWLRVWTADNRIVVTVSDQGSGPTDPFAGLLPAAKAPAGGLGLWLTHQLCSLVTFDYHDSDYHDSFTIRLIAGDPHSGC